MSDRFGLWIYRVAFAFSVAVSVLLLNFVLQARLLWFPSYERQMVLEMKRIEESVQSTAKQQPAPRGKVRRKFHRSARARA